MEAQDTGSEATVSRSRFWEPSASDNALFTGVRGARLYPFRPHSKAFRLGALRTLAALLPCPAPRATRKKSPEPTSPFSPAQSHLRKLGRVCGTTPPAGRLLCSAPFVGGRGGLRARTSPTAPGWCAGSPSPTTAFASLSRDAAALPGRLSLSASARRTT